MTRSFNLIPQMVREQRRARRRAVRWTMAGVVYGGLLVGGIVSVTLGGSIERDANGIRRVSIEERIATTQRKIDAAHDELHELGLGIEAGIVSAERPAWSALLGVLAQARGDRVLLDSCSVDMASGDRPDAEDDKEELDPLHDARRHGFELELRGAGLTQSDVTRFALRLEELDLFERVSLQEMHRGSALGRSAIIFRISATMRGEETGS